MSNLHLQLCYLPFRAMAEPTRMCLRYGNIPYEDHVVWGRAFAELRDSGAFPYDKVPVIHATVDGVKHTVAQSGSICRYAAKLAGCYPADALAAARCDHVFEMAQEMCTINPLINCYTGPDHARIKQYYFRDFPDHCDALVRQLGLAKKAAGGGKDAQFFGGARPTYADFNVYHMLSNARLSEADCLNAPHLAPLREFMDAIEDLPTLRGYLERRPKLVGIGTDPALVDRNGRRVSQRDPEGECMLVDDCFVFAEAEAA